MTTRSPRKVLFLGGNNLQVPYLIELQNRGLEVYCTDFNGQAPIVQYAEHFSQVSYEDVDRLIEIGTKYHFTQRDCVFTAAEHYAYIGASRFAEYFGIPFPPVKSIEICLSKLQFYRLFAEYDLAIPETKTIENLHELNDYLAGEPSGSIHFLKSDYSKNPKYIYRVSPETAKNLEIQWTKDRFLREAYVIQKEFVGFDLRLFYIDGRFALLPFFGEQQIPKSRDYLLQLLPLDQIKSMLTRLQLHKWFIKFDVKVDVENNRYAFLDIGLDPPNRFRDACERQGVPFVNQYLDHYLDGIVNYSQDIG